MFPADENKDRVLSLERLWAVAARNKTGNHSRRSTFKSAQPWKSLDPKQVRRWNDFVRLDARLLEWSADPREFAGAAMDYFQTCVQGFLPNPRQVSGPVGKQIWETWREKRQAEGNQGVQGEQRVEAAAFLATQSEAAALQAELRNAYQACREQGSDLAPTLLWGPEVLWLMWTTEPATRFGIEGQFGQLRDDERPWWRKVWRGTAEDPRARARLLAIRREVTGTDGPILVVEPEAEPVPSWQPDPGVREEDRQEYYMEMAREVKRAEWAARVHAGTLRLAREKEARR